MESTLTCWMDRPNRDGVGLVIVAKVEGRREDKTWAGRVKQNRRCIVVRLRRGSDFQNQGGKINGNNKYNSKKCGDRDVELCRILFFSLDRSNIYFFL